MTTPTFGAGPKPGLILEFPVSIGLFEKYEEAQKAVDTLSDKDFPVENVMIVGADLRQVERITGRMSPGRAVLGGLLSGMWMGLFVGLIFLLFTSSDPVSTVASTVLFGGAFWAVWAYAGYKVTGGKRDFTSVTQVVATRYEVLCEHKCAQQARDLLDPYPRR